MAPVVGRLAGDSRFETRVCVTAQHREMLDQVLQLFNIKPDYDLGVMKQGQNLAEVTSGILSRMGGVFEDFPGRLGSWFTATRRPLSWRHWPHIITKSSLDMSKPDFAPESAIHPGRRKGTGG